MSIQQPFRMMPSNISIDPTIILNINDLKKQVESNSSTQSISNYRFNIYIEEGQHTEYITTPFSFECRGDSNLTALQFRSYPLESFLYDELKYEPETYIFNIPISTISNNINFNGLPIIINLYIPKNSKMLFPNEIVADSKIATGNYKWNIRLFWQYSDINPTINRSVLSAVTFFQTRETFKIKDVWIENGDSQNLFENFEGREDTNRYIYYDTNINKYIRNDKALIDSKHLAFHINFSPSTTPLNSFEYGIYSMINSNQLTAKPITQNRINGNTIRFAYDGLINYTENNNLSYGFSLSMTNITNNIFDISQLNDNLWYYKENGELEKVYDTSQKQIYSILEFKVKYENNPIFSQIEAHMECSDDSIEVSWTPQQILPKFKYFNGNEIPDSSIEYNPTEFLENIPLTVEDEQRSALYIPDNTYICYDNVNNKTLELPFNEVIVWRGSITENFKERTKDGIVLESIEKTTGYYRRLRYDFTKNNGSGGFVYECSDIKGEYSASLIDPITKQEIDLGATYLNWYTIVLFPKDNTLSTASNSPYKAWLIGLGLATGLFPNFYPRADDDLMAYEAYPQLESSINIKTLESEPYYYMEKTDSIEMPILSEEESIKNIKINEINLYGQTRTDFLIMIKYDLFKENFKNQGMDSQGNIGIINNFHNIGFQLNLKIENVSNISFLANFNYNFEAGNTQVTDGTIIGWDVYKQINNELFMTKIVSFTAKASIFRDYLVANGSYYKYTIYPVIESKELNIEGVPTGNIILTYGTPLQTEKFIKAEFWNWNLLTLKPNFDRGKNVYQVDKQFKFTADLITTEQNNNAQITLQNNFTKYPKMFVGTTNAMSGSLTALVGKIVGKEKPRWSVELEVLTDLRNLNTDKTLKVLKDRQGFMYLVGISSAIGTKVRDNTIEQLTDVTISWQEIGSLSDLGISCINKTPKTSWMFTIDGISEFNTAYINLPNYSLLPETFLTETKTIVE